MAKVKAPKADSSQFKSFVQELPVALTLEQVAGKSDEHRKKTKEKEAELLVFEGIKQKHKDKIAVFDAELRKLDEARDTHAELRMIECERKYDFERNRVIEYRKDTDEIIGERAMEQGEREELAQGELIPPSDSAQGELPPAQA